MASSPRLGDASTMKSQVKKGEKRPLRPPVAKKENERNSPWYETVFAGRNETNPTRFKQLSGCDRLIWDSFGIMEKRYYDSI